MAALKAIDNGEDVLDSRDIIARIDYLENAGDGDDEDEDECEELEALRQLADEADGIAEDWQYGATLIRDSYFEDYAWELAFDIGAISGDEKWPLTCINWEQAARELQMDYSTVEFGGVTYWVRTRS